MKKAQIEIAGLLIIVVLVSVVILFVLSFNFSEDVKKESDSQDKRENPIRDRFPQALLETNTECEGRSVRDLIADCAFEGAFTCSGLDSCEYANETIKQILAETYDEFGFSYVFEISTDTGVAKTLFNHTDCDLSSSNYKTKKQFFRTDFGDMTLYVRMCS